MSPHVPSYDTVNYGVRTSKQLERRIFLEVLHRLGRVGLFVSDYNYIGLGSVFYIDFMLFHRYLYIDRMECVENTDIPNRMSYNQPFPPPYLNVRMCDVSDMLQNLSRDQKYLVWLDYDTPLDAGKLEDIDGVISNVGIGSVLIVTVDAKTRLPKVKYGEKVSRADLESRYCAQLEKSIGKFVAGGVQPTHIYSQAHPRLSAEAVLSRIARSMASRPSLKFVQLFNYEYSDGATMLTVGGVVGEPNLRDRLQAEGVMKLPYINETSVPISITVPPITAREKSWVEQHVGIEVDKKDWPFELKTEYMDSCKRFYRHYPDFHDVLL
jgi:hypothetical protein